MKKISMKIRFLLIMTVSLFMMTSCVKIYTPEELIKAPELNIENKEIKDALAQMLPQDAVLYSTSNFNKLKTNTLSQGKSFFLQDFDNDGTEEVVALYKNSKMQTFGVIILKKYSGIWNKAQEIKINSIEILDFDIVDIDDDGLNEIIIGYIDGNEKRILSVFHQERLGLNEIFKSEYYSFTFSNIGEQNKLFLLISNFGSEPLTNKVKLFQFTENSFRKVDELIYPKGYNPYNVQVGKIDQEHFGIFVDLFVYESYGQSDVLMLQEGKLKSISSDSNNISTTQDTPIACSDIDGDGIIEVPQTSSIMLPNEGLSHRKDLFVRNYYKIISLSQLKLVAQVYEDTVDMKIRINFPFEFFNKVLISKDPYSNKLTLYYCPEETAYEAEGYPFLEILSLDVGYKNRYKDYIFVHEDENTIIVARPIDESDKVPKRFLREYEGILNLSEFPDVFLKRVE